MLDFSKHPLNDAEIFQIIPTPWKLLVRFKNWQEKKFQFEFEDVIGYQCFNPEGQSLSHGTTKENGTFLSMAFKSSGESAINGYKVYSFVSAWDDAEILSVVAKTIHLVELAD